MTSLISAHLVLKPFFFFGGLWVFCAPLNCSIAARMGRNYGIRMSWEKILPWILFTFYFSVFCAELDSWTACMCDISSRQTATTSVLKFAIYSKRLMPAYVKSRRLHVNKLLRTILWASLGVMSTLYTVKFRAQVSKCISWTIIFICCTVADVW